MKIIYNISATKNNYRSNGFKRLLYGKLDAKVFPFCLSKVAILIAT